jgi:uncharacterized membrane protein YhaH (DUF805 family)
VDREGAQQIARAGSGQRHAGCFRTRRAADLRGSVLNVAKKMKRIFSYQDRIGRREYAISCLGGLFACAFLYQLAKSFPIFGLLFIVIYPAYVWLLFSQGAKRCHGRDNSGWFQLVPFYALWLLFAEGHDGRNQYGPDPRW